MPVAFLAVVEVGAELGPASLALVSAVWGLVEPVVDLNLPTRCMRAFAVTSTPSAISLSMLL